VSALDRIFARKHEEVAAARLAVPIEELKARARDAGPTRGFHRALRESPSSLALIAEVKRASPSRGLIRADFDPVTISQAYERAGADALSILTDVDYFQGHPANIRLAREATSLPCLRKDFLDDPYQVYEARAWEADAILLIVAWLSREQIADLAGLANELGMDVLVEVHNAEETEVALNLMCPLIGVNNRNLADFTTDLSTSERLIPLIAPHATAISESALETPADLARVKAAGARGVLIGTTFCQNPDIEAKVREVMSR
jgi:indole-3-glycerol phosphate synthase